MPSPRDLGPTTIQQVNINGCPASPCLACRWGPFWCSGWWCLCFPVPLLAAMRRTWWKSKNWGWTGTLNSGPCPIPSSECGRRQTSGLGDFPCLDLKTKQQNFCFILFSIKTIKIPGDRSGSVGSYTPFKSNIHLSRRTRQNSVIRYSTAIYQSSSHQLEKYLKNHHSSCKRLMYNSKLWLWMEWENYRSQGWLLKVKPVYCPFHPKSRNTLQTHRKLRFTLDVDV